MFTLIRKCVAWLRQFAHPQTEEIPMSDVTVPPPAVPAAESVLAKLKDILKTVGHDVEAVWDEAVALAKKVA
jgi:hypothetical protein